MPVVAPGHDAVTDGRGRAVSQESAAVASSAASQDSDLVGAGVQFVHGAGVGGLQQDDLAGGGVVGRGGDGLVEQGVGVTTADAPGDPIGVDRPWVAHADAQGGGGLPGLGEAVQGGQLGGQVLVGKHPEPAAGPDGWLLGGVADQHHLGAGVAGLVQDCGQGRGVGQGGLVEHDDLPTVQAPRLNLGLDLREPAADRSTRGRAQRDAHRQVAGFMAAGLVAAGLEEPFGGGLGAHTQPVAQHTGGGRRRRQRDRRLPVQLGPRLHDGSQSGRLAGPGRPDQGVHDPARAEHRRGGRPLVTAQRRAGVQEPVDHGGRRRPERQGLGCDVEQVVFGGQDRGGGEPFLPDAAHGAVVQPHAPAGGGGHELANQPDPLGR